jgi:hypothetical protein
VKTPDADLRSTTDEGTAVGCACGARLFTLAPGEGVYPQGVLMRTLADHNEQRTGVCTECDAQYSIPVSRWAQPTMKGKGRQ